MAACSFLDGKGASDSFVINGDMVEEIFAGLWEIFSREGATRFFTGKTALYRSGEEAHCGLGSQDFEEIRVGDQGSLIQVQ